MMKALGRWIDNVFFAESLDAYKQSLAFGAPGKSQAENDLGVRFSA